MLFIINPTSAGGRTAREWARTRRELRRRQIPFSEHLTSRPGEAITAARRALHDGCDRVIAVGGDGTLNEVVNGYFDEADRAVNPAAAVGLLPSGTGSDFRRSIGIVSRAGALDAILSGRRRSIDAARVELRGRDGQSVSRYLINLASFGLGGDAVAMVNSWRETLPRFPGGKLRFMAAALLALRKYRLRPVCLRLDQGKPTEIQSGFFVVANGKFAGGGMMLAPEAELDDGMLDIVVTNNGSRWEIIKELPRIKRGAYLRHPKVSLRRARVAEITSESPLAVDVDGEFIGFTPARLKVLPSAVNFIVGGSWAG
jgi:YegS/Rv2252/BmrU family lipid kinase